MKKILLIALVLGILGRLRYTGTYTIHRGKPTRQSEISISSSPTRSPKDITPLTGGILLISPNAQNWTKRSTYVSQFFSHIGEKYLYIWIYQLTLREAKAYLKHLAKNATDIRIIIENNKYRQQSNDLKKLRTELQDHIHIEADAKLPVTYTHAKTFVGPNFFIIQTANLTHSSFAKNIEHMYIGTQEEIRKNLYDVFAADWYTITKQSIGKREKKPTSFSLHPNLLVCPIDCRKKLETILRSATKSIWTFQQYISDPGIQDIITEKIHQKVDVRVILPLTPDNQKLLPLRGVKYLTLLKKPYVHSKTFLIDEKYLIVGSMNMSSNSLDNNREIGIFITDPQLIQQRKKNFLSYWQK